MKEITVNKTASKGYGFGQCFLAKPLDLKAEEFSITAEQTQDETAKLSKAMAEVQQDLSLLAENSSIFNAHLEVLTDPTLLSAIEDGITLEQKNVQLALEDATASISALFASLDDAYLRERVADIQDVSKRIMAKLKGVDLNIFAQIQKEVIIVAEDLSPSDTANMNFDFVKGLITAKGGVTSHVAIIARQLKLPAMVGVSDIFSHVQDGDSLILDGMNHVIYCNPEEDVVETVKAKAQDYEDYCQNLKQLLDLPSVTKDGREVELFANVGNAKDVKVAFQSGAEGVGLFRTELLYMDQDHFPTEEEQFQAYKEAILLANAPMIVRTLDIGGDKSLPYFQFETEENPFLGYRAIRMCLDMKEDVFKPQLKALLRASAFGDIRIMYPMIISVEEFLEANTLLEECKEELRRDNVAFSDKIPTGVMIETPSAVLLSRQLAKVVDFFSIGTNDLTQYLLCVDRGNQKIAELYNSFHPSVLNAIEMVIRHAHAEGKKVGVCGEFAADERAVKILLGLGLDEFSMASSGILEIKHLLRSLDYKESREYALNLCQQATVAEVMAIIEG